MHDAVIAICQFETFIKSLVKNQNWFFLCKVIVHSDEQNSIRLIIISIGSI